MLFEVRSRGRTPGKRWTGLRVVRAGGQPVTFVPSCVRNVMRLVDILPLALRDRDAQRSSSRARNQRLGDLAAGTLVVRDRPGRHARRARAGGVAPPGRASDGWDVSAVSAQDVAHRAPVPRPPRRRSRPARARELAGELERRLRPRVAGAPEQLAAEEFLERLAAAKADRASVRWKADLTSRRCQANFPFDPMNNRVKELRDERGLSQQQLGEAMDVSRQTINSIEKERYTPSLPLAIALARYFGTQVEEIFHVDDDPPSEMTHEPPVQHPLVHADLLPLHRAP